MGKLFTQGWYDRVEALLAGAVVRVSSSFSLLLDMARILALSDENAGAGVVVGQTVTLSAGAVQIPALGNPGAFPNAGFTVSAMMNAKSSAAADEITFALLRDGVAIAAAPQPTATTDANKLATVTMVWKDEAPPAGFHTYAIQATNITGANTVDINGSGSSSILVQGSF